MPATTDASLPSLIAARDDEMRADLAAHVAIPTGHNHTPGLDNYRAILTARLEAIGARTELIPGAPRPDWLRDAEPGAPIPPTAICRKPAVGDGSTARVLLLGHLDTVFPPDAPFSRLEVSADRTTATGPGVVDMKGGLLVAVVALEALAEAGIDVPWTFILNADEETGSFHSRATLEREAADHDVGLVFEPALPDGSLAIERKGSAQFLIETRGTAAHAGRDFDKGVSAVYALARTLIDVEAMSDLHNAVTVNVGPIDGGHATNAVPDRARAWGNARFPDETSARALQKRLEALSTPPNALPRTIVRHAFNRPAKPRTPHVHRLAETARDVAESLGQSLPFSSTGGVCDGNILQAAGLLTLDTLGVRGGALHTHQEWIDLSSLVERAQLVACLIARLASRSDRPTNDRPPP